MRAKLTPAFVAKPPAPEAGKDRVIHWDQSQPGFGLVVTASGHASYVVQYRVGHRSRRMHLKGGLTLSQAKNEAKKYLGDVAKGADPLAEKRKAAIAGVDTFRAISASYIAREGKGLRSIQEREAILKRHVFPKLGSWPIGQIKRSDVVKLLDGIHDKAGPSAADHTLAIIRRIMSWHAARSDDFRSPIVRGMSRTKPSENARERVLSDDELRKVWSAAEASKGLFGPFVQFLLLTASRRTEAATMARAELVGDSWVIPASRYKTGVEMVVPLTAAAVRALGRVPLIGNSPWVFTTDGARPFSGYSKAKAAFDKACGVTDWTLHDLRRTARSLMSRAGVNADVAERCLGHVIGGVRGVYDRHAYLDEKKHAFEALAALVERILNPPAGNVVELASVRAS
jgi:integrase